MRLLRVTPGFLATFLIAGSACPGWEDSCFAPPVSLPCKQGRCRQEKQGPKTFSGTCFGSSGAGIERCWGKTHPKGTRESCNLVDLKKIKCSGMVKHLFPDYCCPGSELYNCVFMGLWIFQGTKHTQAEESREREMLERGSTDGIGSTEARRVGEKSRSLHPPKV